MKYIKREECNTSDLEHRSQTPDDALGLQTHIYKSLLNQIMIHEEHCPIKWV